MPYASIDALPDTVKALPIHAQRIYMAAFNSAFERDADEQRAHAVAWAAVKGRYEKDEASGEWHAKEAVPPPTVTVRVTEGLEFLGPVEGDESKRDYMVRIARAGKQQVGNRYYPKEPLRRAVEMYDGSKMYLDHSILAEEAARGARSTKDWVSTIKRGSVRFVDEGEHGDLIAVAHIHDDEFARRMQDPVYRGEIGLSHDVRMKARMRTIDGEQRQVVDQITRVLSVDWVPEGNLSGRVIENAPEGADDMEFDEITMEQITEARPDLVQAIEQRAREAAKAGVAEMVKAQVAEQVEQRVSEAVAEAKTETEKRVREALGEKPEGGDDKSQFSVEDVRKVVQAEVETRVAEALGTQKTELEALRAREARREREAQIDVVLAGEKGLSEVGRARVREALAGEEIAAEHLVARVQESVAAERQHELDVLAAHGGQTRVTGMGSGKPGAQDTVKRAREAYADGISERLRESGMTETQIEEYLKVG